MIKNIKAYKTTILGLAFLGFAGYAIVKGIDINVYVEGGIIVSGLLLLISPDTIPNLIENSIGAFLKSPKKDEPEING